MASLFRERNCKKNISLLLVQIWLPDALCILMKTWSQVPDFLFSWWMGSSAAEERHTFFLPFLLPAALLGALSQPLTIVYDEGCIPAHLQVVYAVPQGRAQEKNVFFREEKWNLSTSDANQTGGKEGGAGYSQKDSEDTKKWTWQIQSATEVICPQFSDLVSNHRADRIQGLCGAGHFSVLWKSGQTLRFHQAGWEASLMGEDLWPRSCSSYG